ncbi:MAG: uracil-DNA glycosylase family protein, partial [Anaerolineae bacterium]
TLFGALHRAGFANQPTSKHRGDGLTLNDAYITAVGRCAPPKNRPTRQELRNCRAFLIRELELLDKVEVVLALGRIAFDEYRRTLGDLDHDLPRLDFTHGACYHLGDDLPALVVSYHPSRQNTQTGRLTLEMFDAVFDTVRALLEGGHCDTSGS